jgi:hypothetical protein
MYEWVTHSKKAVRSQERPRRKQRRRPSRLLRPPGCAGRREGEGEGEEGGDGDVREREGVRRLSAR